MREDVVITEEDCFTSSSSGGSDHEDCQESAGTTHPRGQQQQQGAPIAVPAADNQGSGGGTDLLGPHGTAGATGHDPEASNSPAPALVLSDEDSKRMLARADELKAEGNALYGEGKYAEAAAKYNEAISAGKWYGADDPHLHAMGKASL